jgi:hypothetical protein
MILAVLGTYMGAPARQTHRAHELLPHHSTDARFDIASACGRAQRTDRASRYQCLGNALCKLRWEWGMLLCADLPLICRSRVMLEGDRTHQTAGRARGPVS